MCHYIAWARKLRNHHAGSSAACLAIIHSEAGNSSRGAAFKLPHHALTMFMHVTLCCRCPLLYEGYSVDFEPACYPSTLTTDKTQADSGEEVEVTLTIAEPLGQPCGCEAFGP